MCRNLNLTVLPGSSGHHGRQLKTRNIGISRYPVVINYTCISATSPKRHIYQEVSDPPIADAW